MTLLRPLSLSSISLASSYENEKVSMQGQYSSMQKYTEYYSDLPVATNDLALTFKAFIRAEKCGVLSIRMMISSLRSLVR